MSIVSTRNVCAYNVFLLLVVVVVVVACVWLLLFFSSVPFGCCSWAGFSYTQLIHVFFFSFNWIGSIRRNHTHAHNIYATDSEMEIGWRNANRSLTGGSCSSTKFRERNIVSKSRKKNIFFFHRRHTLATLQQWQVINYYLGL